MQFNWRVIEMVVKLIHFLHVESLWSRVFVLSAPCGIIVGCMQRGWYLSLDKSSKAILVLTQHDLLVWTHAKGLNVNTFPLKAQILAKAKSSMTEVMQQATGWGIPKWGWKRKSLHIIQDPSPQTKQCCKSSNLKSKHPPALLCPRINFHLLPSFLFLELFHAWRKPSVCVCVCCSIHNIFQSWGGGSWAKNSFWKNTFPPFKTLHETYPMGYRP